MTVKKQLIAVAIAPLVCSGVLAQKATGDAEDTSWKGDAELGYVSVSGNTEATTLKAHLKAEKAFAPKWNNTVLFDALNTSENKARSAERYFLSDQLDRELSEREYAFGYASYERDRYSGYKYSGIVAAGYGVKLIERDNMTWDLAAGPGYRYSELDEPQPDGDDVEKDLILRMNTEFMWKFSETAQFDQTLSVETGSENTVTKSSTSVKTNLSGALFLKVAYNVKYTKNVPTENKHADTETVVTIAYSF